MAGQRWMVSGGLLVLAGGLTTVSTWRHWAGCRTNPAGSACLTLQEETYGLPIWGAVGHRDTLGAALAAAAAVLLSVAWFIVAGWARRSAARTAVAAILGLQPLLLCLLVTFELVSPGRFVVIITSGWLAWPAEVLVFPLLLGAGWILDEPPAQIFRLIALGWAVTSFGPMHQLADHVTTSLLFPSAAHSPRNLGYATAVTQIALGVAVVIISLVLGSGTEPEGDERSGRDGFTLAA